MNFDRIFSWINIALLGIIGLIALYPFYYILALSFCTPADAASGGVFLFPRTLSFEAYRMVFSYPELLTGTVNSVLRTVIGTVLTVFLSALCAYPLANRALPHRKLFLVLLIATMVFSGGIVPTYMLMNNLGLTNSFWVLILPNLVSAFNVIIIRNFFQGLPPGYAEAARMDGAGEWTILFRIYMPLSKPALATVALWTAVFHCNSWFDAMIYITDDRKQVLQNIVQRIVIDGSTELLDSGTLDSSISNPEGLKAACVILTVLPMICLYPFVQKYFVKGINLGGIKE